MRTIIVGILSLLTSSMLFYTCWCFVHWDIMNFAEITPGARVVFLTVSVIFAACLYSYIGNHYDTWCHKIKTSNKRKTFDKLLKNALK